MRRRRIIDPRIGHEDWTSVTVALPLAGRLSVDEFATIEISLSRSRRQARSVTMATLRRLWTIGVLLSAALWVPPDGIATGAPAVTETPAAPANFDAFLASCGLTPGRAASAAPPSIGLSPVSTRSPRDRGDEAPARVRQARGRLCQFHGVQRAGGDRRAARVPPCRDLSGRRAEVRRHRWVILGILGN